MKDNFYFGILSLFALVFISCKSSKTDILSKKVDEVEVIKFMGTITTQSRSIDEKAFWYFKDEHAKLIIRNSGFIEDVKDVKNHKYDDFEEYNYAFIVKKGKSVDTLYSDNSLKTWILKKNKENIYYYDEEGKIAENLRNTYSFFRECW